jgi:hypothetical protein
MANLADAPRLEANYGSGQWTKAQWVHYSPSGTYTQTEPGGPITSPEGSIYTVHYFINLISGERVKVKFTNKPRVCDVNGKKATSLSRLTSTTECPVAVRSGISRLGKSTSFME